MSSPEVESALLITGSLWHSDLERSAGHEHFVDCTCSLSSTLRDRLRFRDIPPDQQVLYDWWRAEVEQERKYGTFPAHSSYSTAMDEMHEQGKDKIMLPEEDPETGILRTKPKEQITPVGQPIVDFDEFKMFVNDERAQIKDLTPEQVQDRIRELEKLAQEARTRQQACVVYLEEVKLQLSEEHRARLRERDQQYRVQTAEKIRKNRSSGDATGGGVKRGGRTPKSKRDKAIDIYMKMGMDQASAEELANKTFGANTPEADEGSAE